MIYFFLISLGLLLLSLVVSLFVKKAPRMQAAVLSVLGAVSAFALLGLLFTRFFGGRIEFMHPWAFVLLLVVLAVFLGQTLFKKSFSIQHSPLLLINFHNHIISPILTYCFITFCFPTTNTITARAAITSRKDMPPRSC